MIFFFFGFGAIRFMCVWQIKWITALQLIRHKRLSLESQFFCSFSWASCFEEKLWNLFAPRCSVLLSPGEYTAKANSSNQRMPHRFSASAKKIGALFLVKQSLCKRTESSFLLWNVESGGTEDNLKGTICMVMSGTNAALHCFKKNCNSQTDRRFVSPY